MHRAARGGIGLGVATALAGCATTPARPPVEAVRYHYDPVAERGVVVLDPPPPEAGPPSLEYQTYAAAVETQLVRLGFTLARPGFTALYRVSVTVNQQSQPLPPRRSPVSIGLGASSFSGGYRGGTGVGGGVSFPIGGHRARQGVFTQLDVRLRRGPDDVWEGHARTLSDAAAPDGAPGPLADRLTGALFSGFPGDSGRTIEVR